MAATLIEPTDIIDVSSLSMLIYGPPGTGKTSLAQTAADPITLDLDRGAHRSFNRRSVMRFDCWRDIEDAWAQIAKRLTTIVDTIGRGLDLLASDIIEANAKHGTRAGGLTLQGFGALKARFAQWNGQLITAGKDRVLIAHEKEERDGDDRIMRPDVQGGSYTELMKSCDLVGYLYRDRASKRFLDFNPTDKHLGKNAAGWGVIEVPDLADNKTFLADLLADAKRRIGRTAESSAAAAAAVAEWQTWLDSDPNLEEFNARIPKVGGLHNGVKAQVRKILMDHAKKVGLVWNAQANQYHKPTKTESQAAESAA